MRFGSYLSWGGTSARATERLAPPQTPHRASPLCGVALPVGLWRVAVGRIPAIISRADAGDAGFRRFGSVRRAPRLDLRRDAHPRLRARRVVAGSARSFRPAGERRP